jgi:hypothetical protein
MKSLEDIGCYSSRPLMQLKGVEIVSHDSNLEKMESKVNTFLEKFGVKEFADTSHQIYNSKLKVTIKLKSEFANLWCPYFGTLNIRKIIPNKSSLSPDELD